MEADTYNGQTEDLITDNERYHYWSMNYGENNGGVYDSKRWGVYMKEKFLLIKGGYSVEVLGSNDKKLF